MRLLVTGGAGFIGSHLSRRLVEQGHSVRVVDNLSTGFRHNLDAISADVEFVEGDLRDADAMLDVCRGMDAVFHLAAMGSVPRSIKDPRTTYEINVTGTLNVLEGVRHNDVGTIVYASSSSIYGDSHAEFKDETQPFNPISPYGASKASAELNVLAFGRAYGFNALALRYFNVFGPQQNPEGTYAAVIPVFITHALRGEPWTINGDGRHSRDFTYVANVVDANLKALAKAPSVDPVAMNVACGGSISLLELSDAVREYADAAGVEPVHGPERAGDIVRSRAAIDLAAATLDYEVVVDWREGLRETVAWYRDGSA
ncbi:MAG: SDR family NAD(P)-dependent oxidoreductase [Acidimicrobiia bacterium]|nr:SDR family NAD(P)-dependent oxidoreductase [Acidimicrobiia bacterium]